MREPFIKIIEVIVTVISVGAVTNSLSLGDLTGVYALTVLEPSSLE